MTLILNYLTANILALLGHQSQWQLKHISTDKLVRCFESRQQTDGLDCNWHQMFLPAHHLQLRTKLSINHLFCNQTDLAVGRVLHHREHFPVGGHVPVPLCKLLQEKYPSRKYNLHEILYRNVLHPKCFAINVLTKIFRKKHVTSRDFSPVANDRRTSTWSEAASVRYVSSSASPP